MLKKCDPQDEVSHAVYVLSVNLTSAASQPRKAAVKGPQLQETISRLSVENLHGICKVLLCVIDEWLRDEALFITTWIDKVKVPQTLVNGGSLIEIIVEQNVLINQPFIKSDEVKDSEWEDVDETLQYIMNGEKSDEESENNYL
ncbi:hypothetical protein I7I51_02244 [Histoplasma capsulatum]|uniref:Uncharacterized protein n=1 Tax=Ajellomyces capsulatus TaxID=5037 RepID=A0A8A1MED8_AJECA|nr:hypothetical protein I7I51_02244 [Histoplasma capsulatum]